MKKIILILIVTMVLTGCQKEEVIFSAYDGNINVLQREDVESYKLLNFSQFNTIHVNQNDDYMYDYGEYQKYMYLDESEVRVSVYETEDNDFYALTREFGDVYFYDLYEYVFPENLDDISVEFGTNHLIKEDGRLTYELWLDETDTVIEVKVTITDDSSLLWHLYDINNTDFEVPQHEITGLYEYILSDMELDFILTETTYAFSENNWTFTYNSEDFFTQEITYFGEEFEYNRLYGLISYENVDYTFEEFKTLFPTFEDSLIDIFLEIENSVVTIEFELLSYYYE